MNDIAASGRVASRAPSVVAKESTTTFALLIWTFQRQMVHLSDNTDLIGPEIDLLRPGMGRSNDGCARLADIGDIGCEIDGGGFKRRVVHPDADIVAACIKEVGFPGAQLLWEYGRAGGHPHWDVRQHMEPIYLGGRVEVRDLGVEEVRYRREVRNVPVRYCPVQPYPADEYVELCRGEYVMWFAALVRLTAILKKTALKQWDVVEPGAKPYPWKKSG